MFGWKKKKSAVEQLCDNMERGADLQRDLKNKFPDADEWGINFMTTMVNCEKCSLKDAYRAYLLVKDDIMGRTDIMIEMVQNRTSFKEAFAKRQSDKEYFGF